MLLLLLTWAFSALTLPQTDCGALLGAATAVAPTPRTADNMGVVPKQPQADGACMGLRLTGLAVLSPVGRVGTTPL